MPNSTTNNSPIHLNHDEGDRSVVLTPESQDRFIMTCRQAVESCESIAVWRADFESLLEKVTAWAERHESSIRNIYIAPADRRVCVFVESRATTFDFDLAEEVANLSHELLLRFKNVWPEAIVIPGGDSESIGSFVNLAQALNVYGATGES